MPRPKSVIPAYTLHKPTGQARVRIDGRDFYLGSFGSDESRRRFGELVSKHANGLAVDPIAPAGDDDPGPSVAVLVLTFLRHAEAYYVKDGKPSDEYACFKSALVPVTDLFGLLPVKDFGPLHLKTAREKYIAAGWSRGYCNKSTSRVRHVFKWGVENGMVPTATWTALTAVSPLKRGKTAAPDHPKRQAVTSAHMDAVRPLLSQQCCDLFDLLLATAARPAEIIGLTVADIDRTKAVWVARLADHKNAHRGLSRAVYFGPQAQLILRRRMTADLSQPLFSMHHDTLSEALRQACDTAQVPRFSPYHLRHTALTRIRDELGLETAQAAAGHARPDMTTLYTSKLDKLAAIAAAKFG